MLSETIIKQIFLKINFDYFLIYSEISMKYTFYLFSMKKKLNILYKLTE